MNADPYSSQVPTGGESTALDLIPQNRSVAIVGARTGETAYDIPTIRAPKEPAAIDSGPKNKISVLLRQIGDALERARAEDCEDTHLRQERIDDAVSLWSDCYGSRRALRRSARHFLSLLLPCLKSPALISNDEACEILAGVVAEFAQHLDVDDKDVDVWTDRLRQTGIDPTWVCTDCPEDKRQ